MVGIGCMTCEFPQAIAEARRLKQSHPGLKIVFGGAHPTGDPAECLQSGAVDYVVVGEGEIPLAKLLDALKSGCEPDGIQGVWKLKDGMVVPGGSAEVPLIDELPPMTCWIWNSITGWIHHGIFRNRPAPCNSSLSAAAPISVPTATRFIPRNSVERRRKRCSIKWSGWSGSTGSASS
jgi:B12 binding domain